MYVVVTLLILILVTGWGGYELRGKQPGVSQVLYGFAILLAILLTAAFFNVV